MEHALDLRVENPVTNAAVGLVGRLLRLSPVYLHLIDEAVGILLGALLGLLALEGEVILERLCIPRLVGMYDVRLPVVLN